MGWSKKELILKAFEEIGLASYIYDLSEDELYSAAIKLDSMMSSWASRGIDVGYPISPNPNDINLNEKTLVPEIANEAIYLNLAIRIAPSFGKNISIDTKNSAKEAYGFLLTYCLNPCVLTPNYGLPCGAGYKEYYRDFFCSNYKIIPKDAIDVEI